MKKKNILVGLTGSIAAYKSVELVSTLLKDGNEVTVLMTESATKFVQPLTFSILTGNRVYVDMFEGEETRVEHIELAKKADAFIIAPATANTMSKIANGFADNVLTTTFLAAKCPRILAPAMNVNMYNNPMTVNNLKKCQDYGIYIVDSGEGVLACGDIGRGKMASNEEILGTLEMSLTKDKYLQGVKVLISAGPTKESIDPVRFITNHSTGKMGYEIAKAARNLGAEVTLVSGPSNLEAVYGLETKYVTTASEMSEMMKNYYDDADYVIMSAAVSDFRPVDMSLQKIKKQESDLSIELEKTEDILQYLGDHKKDQILCGFAMETEEVLENAYQKFKDKNCDLLVVNDLTVPGAGFGGDTNEVIIISEEERETVGMTTKEALAHMILKRMSELA